MLMQATPLAASGASATAGRAAAPRAPSVAARLGGAPPLSGSAPRARALGGSPFVGGGLPSLRAAATAPRPAAARAGAARRVAVAMAGGKDVVCVTGATGFVGSRLVQMLSSQGAVVRVLARNPAKARSALGSLRGVEFVPPSQWAAAVQGATAVVNLSGEPISTRWTDGIKKEIVRSRVETTRQLVAAINACPEGARPAVLVNGSAVGFYGISDTATFDETSPNGSDFLSDVCRQWEGATAGCETRVVLLRTGIVLEKDGGALAKMLPAFQAFAGGKLGRGDQWFSWIHRDDLCGLIAAAIDDERYEGAINGTAPTPVTMDAVCTAIGGAMGRPSWLPVPDFAIQTLLGEGASLVLDGQKVLPKRALSLGYQFKYTTIEAAVKAIVN